MRRKTKIALMVVLSVEVVVLALIGILLLRERAKLGSSSSGLNLAWSALESIYHRNPFPEQANVDAILQNRDDYQKEMKSLLDSMRKMQVQEPKEGGSPLQWLASLNKMQSDLRTEASGSKIVLPERFAFSFQSYDDGRPPSRNAVPRLTKQLRMVEQLCSLLYKAGIKELVAIKREEFESTSRPRGRTEATAVAEGAESEVDIFESIYARERFIFEFGTKEAALVESLNAIARDPMFIVVANMEITASSDVVQETEAKVDPRARWARRARGGDADNLFTDVDKLSEDAEDAEMQDDKRYRDQRVVSGRAKEANATVTITIDVYTFLKPSESQVGPQS